MLNSGKRSKDWRAHAKLFALQSWEPVVFHSERSSIPTHCSVSSICISGLSSSASTKSVTESRSSEHSTQFPNEKAIRPHSFPWRFVPRPGTHNGCDSAGRSDIERTDHHGLQGRELRLLQELDRAPHQARLSRRRQGL